MKKHHHLFNSIIGFLSNRTNLTIFQCLMYFIIGYVISDYLTFTQTIIILFFVALLQFITRIKSVADGMVFRQIMLDGEIEANEVIKRLKRESDKIKKEDLN